MKNGFLRRCAGALAALVAAAGMVACGGSGGDDTPADAGKGSVAGRVVASADSTPVAGATVSIGSASTQTAADGSFTLADVPASERAMVRVKASGYVDALVPTPVVKDTTQRAVARLVAEAAATSFDAAQAAMITAPGSSARVELPAASLVTASGAAATGTVSVSVTPIDPGADPLTMPGDYTVADGSRIESFGAIKVKLQDAAGNALQLKSGSKATIRIPLASRAANAPQTIPLYYFDENTGRWVQEGSATLKGTGADAYYEGQVSHFTYWNCDQPQETIYVNGCVASLSGQRVPQATVYSQGMDYSGSAMALTDDQGRFRVAIRKNSRASIWAELDDRSSNAVVAGPSDVDITLPDCLVLDTTPVAPTIVWQPASTSATEGLPAAFSVVASGTRTLRYQWQHNGVNIPGAVYEFLYLPAVSAADAGNYRVIVTNDAGSATSVDAVLTVNAPVAPQITTQPADTSASAGDSAIFVVVADGRPAPSYQWRRNGSPIAGATGPIYTTPALTAGDNGATYTVVVSNSQGSVTSREATLTVTNDGSAEQKMQLMRLLGLSFDFYEAASMPMLVVDDDAAVFVSPATVCTTGSLNATLNGGALPAPGTALPPTGTLAATAANCDADDTLYNGSSSVNYNFTGLNPANGSATATVNNVHLRGPATGDAQTDLTANGSATAAISTSIADGQTTANVTLTLASSATLRSELSGMTASFASGNVAWTVVTTNANGIPVRTRVTYNDLRFAVAGVDYLATGFYEVTFSAAGALTGGSGEVLLSSGGTTIGRIYANANGIFIEVNGTVQPFGGVQRAHAR